MKKSHTKKSITSWHHQLKSTSLFVIVCGIVAIFYFGYRIVLIAYPVALIEHNTLHPTKVSVVCAEDEGASVSTMPLLSASYQARIGKLATLSSNLVINPSFANVNHNNGVPVGYEHNIDNKTSSFQYLQDSDKTPFLRIIDTRNGMTNNETTPAWLPKLIGILSDKTYVYSFQYRSSVPVQVALEHTTGTSLNPSDTGITTLQPTKTWQTFTAHLNNTNNYSAFRVVVSNLKPGQVDTRDFDIHQVADGELDQGVISVTFDDGWESMVTNALPVLNKYHILTTQYIITQVAAQATPDYMDYNAILNLKQQGNEIGSHTLRHCDQTVISGGEIQDNAISSKQMLESHNLGPITSFAYPLGHYDQTTQNVYSKQYQFIRTSDAGYNDRYFDEDDIRSMAIVSTTKNSDVQSWINYAKDHHLWLVLVYHQVNGSGSYNVTTANLDQQLSMVAHSGLTVLPLSAAAKSIRN